MTSTLKPGWLADLRTRIGKCILFGLKAEQVTEASALLQDLARDWRELVAGSEGFLTAKSRRGIFRQRVAWGEMDVMGHVNNTAYNRYAESARMNWLLNFGTHFDPAHNIQWAELQSSRGIGLIMRSIRTDYKFPMTYPDRVTVYHKLRSLPTSRDDSFILDVMILSERHQRVAARCVEDVVVYDYRQQNKVPLPPFVHAQFEEAFMLQEEAKWDCSDHARDLAERVRSLERQSWDRADAKEDLGSASP
ncbi:Thioesterase/thiol ester dehydrase-isomerase [Xylona heveae TC161]|uniref:Thioesterase/thiol ester dehydrase-isomerase n=1 Tax=Xylona heveae (strain CBS 132557 / TC161) TaxID=1328760 RepID=A0A165IKK3_XYLHT|nr:Thioesterase/thiol ester dehydrase-isomerase [Xylona heveae TC161]KZF25032.1 Thioesterase/thiol ester dehydrase-isomerase [Xylona heveae TC161]